MKQQDPITKTIGDYNFYIRPFGAMTASKMTGDLAALVTPMLGAVAPLIGKQLNTEDSGLLDIDVSDLGPILSNAFSSLTGDNLERMMSQLLIDHKNIHFDSTESREVKLLNRDELDEIFCMELQDMFLLAFEVLKLNYSGFFRKLASRYGGPDKILEKLASKNSNDMGSTT